MSSPCTDQPEQPYPVRPSPLLLSTWNHGFLEARDALFPWFLKAICNTCSYFSWFLGWFISVPGNCKNSISWQTAGGSLLQTRSWFPDTLQRLTGPWGGWGTLCLVFPVYSKLISLSKMDHCGETEAGHHEHSQTSWPPLPQASSLMPWASLHSSPTERACVAQIETQDFSKTWAPGDH